MERDIWGIKGSRSPHFCPVYIVQRILARSIQSASLYSVSCTDVFRLKWETLCFRQVQIMTASNLSLTQVNGKDNWDTWTHSDRPLMSHCVGLGRMLQNTEVKSLQWPREHFSRIFKLRKEGDLSAFSQIIKVLNKVLQDNNHLWRRLLHYNCVFATISTWSALSHTFSILKNTSVTEEMPNAEVKWTRQNANSDFFGIFSIHWNGSS